MCMRTIDIIMPRWTEPQSPEAYGSLFMCLSVCLCVCHSATIIA